MSESPNTLDWQQDFIATNLLVIGYNAWVGYSSDEHGAIICSTDSPAIGISGETFKTYFVPRSRLAPFLNAWLVTPGKVILSHHFMNTHILEALLLLEFCHQITFFYLKNLPLTPPQCYEQVCKE